MNYAEKFLLRSKKTVELQQTIHTANSMLLQGTCQAKDVDGTVLLKFYHDGHVEMTNAQNETHSFEWEIKGFLKDDLSPCIQIVLHSGEETLVWTDIIAIDAKRSCLTLQDEEELFEIYCDKT